MVSILSLPLFSTLNIPFSSKYLFSFFYLNTTHNFFFNVQSPRTISTLTIPVQFISTFGHRHQIGPWTIIIPQRWTKEMKNPTDHSLFFVLLPSPLRAHHVLRFFCYSTCSTTTTVYTDVSVHCSSIAGSCCYSCEPRAFLVCFAVSFTII